jgi:hypothetical protein
MEPDNPSQQYRGIELAADGFQIGEDASNRVQLQNVAAAAVSLVWSGPLRRERAY